MSLFVRSVFIAACWAGVVVSNHGAHAQDIKSAQNVKSAKACNDELKANSKALKAAGISIREFVRACWSSEPGKPTPLPARPAKNPSQNDQKSSRDVKSAKACHEELSARGAALEKAGVSVREFVRACWNSEPGKPTPLPLRSAETRPQNDQKATDTEVAARAPKKADQVKVASRRQPGRSPFRRTSSERGNARHRRAFALNLRHPREIRRHDRLVRRDRERLARTRFASRRGHAGSTPWSTRPWSLTDRGVIYVTGPSHAMARGRYSYMCRNEDDWFAEWAPRCWKVRGLSSGYGPRKARRQHKVAAWRILPD